MVGSQGPKPPFLTPKGALKCHIPVITDQKRPKTNLTHK